MNLDDSGLGSLRQALLDANQNPGADTIRFARNVRGTLELSSQLVITDDVDIRGPGSNQLTISGGNTSRVIAVLPTELAANPLVTPTAAQVASSPEATIRKLAIANGLATDSPPVLRLEAVCTPGAARCPWTKCIWPKIAPKTSSPPVGP